MYFSSRSRPVKSIYIVTISRIIAGINDKIEVSTLLWHQKYLQMREIESRRYRLLN